MKVLQSVVIRKTTGSVGLSCSNHSSCDVGSGDKELALRRTDPVGRFN